MKDLSLPKCPKCNEDYTYEDGFSYVCPMCHYEWTENIKILDEPMDGHDIQGRVDGFGVIYLKSSVVKK